ncbi:MAG: RimK family alpha-L-glutamate ligase [Saprospiraceae bacterium]|nr:RimK family alpha-L-glutamate ligase [Saprospiraceae bacterium]
MKVLILSRNIGLYSTQRLILECRKRGHNVQVVDPLTCNLIVDNHNPMVIDNSGMEIKADWVLPRIGSTATSYGAAIIRQFELKKIPVITSSQALLQARDKLIALQLLTKNNLPVPKTGLISPLECDANLIRREFEFPAIIKLLDSTHGLGVILSDSLQNGIAVSEAFVRMQKKFIIQKFIKESAGQDIRAFVVNGKIVASMLRKAPEGEYRSNMHRGSTGSHIELTTEEQEVILKASQTLGLEVSGVDIMRSEEGPLILEVNASPGLEGIESVTKVNVAGAIISYGDQLARSSLNG